MDKQEGAALIVVLSLLTVSLMIGLSSMQLSQIDERLAGNYKVKTQTQMGAEKAASVGWMKLRDSKNGLDDFSSTKLSVVEFAGLSWSEFIDDKNFDYFAEVDAGCKIVSCYYRYIRIGGGFYIVTMGGVTDGGGEIEGELVVVKLKGFSDYAGVSAALSVYGAIEDINGVDWYPDENKERIKGGGFGAGSGSLRSLYYEGEEFLFNNSSHIGGGFFDDGLEYGGNHEAVKRSAMEWVGRLNGKVIEKTGSVGVVFSTDDMVFIENKEPCKSYQFSVVESFNVSGGKKFCGVMLHLGSSLTLGDTAVVEGLVLVANPVVKKYKNGLVVKDSGGRTVFDFSKPSGVVELYVNGGSGSGSVYFSEKAVDSAFDLIGENYLEYLDAGGVNDISIFEIESWR